MTRRGTAVLFLTLLLVPFTSAASGVENALKEAQRLSRSGEHAEAIALLKNEVLTGSEDLPTEVRLAALETLGISNEMLRENEKAAEAYTLRWLEIVAEYGADALPALRESSRVATALTRVGSYEEARAFWRVHLASAKRGELMSFINEADVFFGIGRTYEGQKAFARAEQWYLRAIEESPDELGRSMFMMAYADLLMKSERPAEAEKMRSEAEELHESQLRSLPTYGGDHIIVP